MDSNNIINCIKGTLQLAWMIANIIEEIHTTIGKFDSIHVSHEYREANLVDNWFGKKVVKKEIIMIWNTGGDILEDVKSLIELEKI